MRPVLEDVIAPALSWDGRKETAPRVIVDTIDRTMYGGRNWVSWRALALCGRVLEAVERIHRAKGDSDALRIYCHALRVPCSPRYQGNIARALVAGKFATAWRHLSFNLSDSRRPELAYQAALFARNWLLMDYPAARLLAFAHWLECEAHTKKISSNHSTKC